MPPTRRPAIEDMHATARSDPPGWRMMHLAEPHRWVETTDGVRHAVPSDLEFGVGDELTTLCGIAATVDVGDVRRQGLFPECPPCNAAALALLEQRR